MQDTSTIDIDLSAIDHNMSVIRRTVGPDCALCPIVKADAYGLGVTRVARRLVGAGAQMLAVYSLRQAMETAAAVNGAVPVLVLMPVTTIAREDELVRLMLAGQLHLVVHDEAMGTCRCKAGEGPLADAARPQADVQGLFSQSFAIEVWQFEILFQDEQPLARKAAD